MPETNDFATQLNELSEKENPTPNEIDAFIKGLAESTASLDGFDISDLEKLTVLVNGLPDNSPYKEKINNRIEQRIMEFAMQEPSFSLLARHNELSAKGDDITPAERSEKRILEAAAVAIISDSSDNISPSNAVALSDYLKIAENVPSLPDNLKEKFTQIGTNIDKALKEFDDINDLQRFAGMNPDEMDANEEAWSQKAEELLGKVEATEELKIFSHLAVQHLKDKKPQDDAQAVLIREISDIKEQYNETLKTEIISQGANHKFQAETGLSDEEFANLQLLGNEAVQEAYNKFKAETGLSDEEIADLQLSGDKGLLKDEDQKKKYQQFLETRDEFISEYLDDEKKKDDYLKLLKTRNEYIENYIGVDINKAIDDLTLNEVSAGDTTKRRKLQDILQKIKDDPNAPLSDEEKQLYSEYTKRHDALIDTATEATKVAFVRQVENLACRTAKITGAKDITKATKNYLKDFAAKHPKVWMYSKCIAVGGAKAALAWGIAAVAGANGLAAYSAYNTFQTYRKTYKQFQEKTGQTGFKNFMEYLKKPENTDTKINLIRSLATTGVAVGFAVAGNVTGLSALPIYKQATNAVINVGSNIAKAANAFKNKAQKNKKGIIITSAVIAGGTVLGLVATCLPDSIKEKVSDWANGLWGNGDNTPEPEVPANTSDEHFDAAEAQKGIEEAGKIDPELTKEIDPLRQSFNSTHAANAGNNHDIGADEANGSSEPASSEGSATSDGNGDNSEGQPEETAKEEPKEDIRYSFEQRSGGIFSHHKDTLDADAKGEFTGGTMKVTPRLEGETDSEYNDRLIREANGNIKQNSELSSEEYHGKITITKNNGSEIRVKQEVDYSHKGHLEEVRRKVEIRDSDSEKIDTYKSTTKVYRDDDGHIEHTSVKYHSHQVESETVGEAGGKADKLLREATVRGEDGVYRTGQLYKDGATGDKVLRVTDENGTKDYAVEGVGSKKIMKAFVESRGNLGNNR